MSYISNKVSGLTVLNTFTAKVIQDNSPNRYGNQTYKSVTFTRGTEYIGPNIFKDLNRPPKLRILSIFRPLINGNPNANNDTYVAFSVYDYTLNTFRGPWCRRSNVNDPWTYVDFYVTTIDKFGKNYGNLFTADNGASTSSFTAPTATYQSTLNTTMGGLTLTVSSGHYTGCFMFGGPNNTSIDFNGFFTLSGLNGSYCFYTIANSGIVKTFRNTIEDNAYLSDTYPYLTPVTSKYESEWRCSPICSIDNASYQPLIRPGNGISSGGQIKYKATSVNPSFDFDNDIAIMPVYVWTNYNGNEWVPFYTGKIFADGGGVQGTSGYAPAGYYGLYNFTVYGYWDGNGNWSQVTDYGSPPVQFTKYIIYGDYPDPMSACDNMGAPMYEVYIDPAGPTPDNPGVVLYGDSAGTSPFQPPVAFRWWKFHDEYDNNLNYSNVITDDARTDTAFACPK